MPRLGTLQLLRCELRVAFYECLLRKRSGTDAISPGRNDPRDILVERLHGVNFSVISTKRMSLEVISAFANLAIPSQSLPPLNFRYGRVDADPENIKGR